MDHKAFVAALSPETRARLTRRSDRAGLRHLAGHAGAILLTGGLIASGLPFWWLLLPVQGILVVFLFTLQHETTHDTPFRSLWLNRLAGAACGVILLLPPRWFTYFHLAHHRHTQDPARDPELATPLPATRRGWLWHVSGLPLWAGSIRILIRNAAGRNADPFVPGGGKTAVRAEAQAMLAGYAALAAVSLWQGWTWPLWLWIVPLLLGQPFLRLYLLAEHGRCPQVANMLKNSRTTLTTRLVRLIAWNMPYHAEHHSYPTVPFHHLPDLHQIAKPHLGTVQNGYAAFQKRYFNSLN